MNNPLEQGSVVRSGKNAITQAPIRQTFYYGIPMLFCITVHWLALKTWFYSDDFAWLGLSLRIHSVHDLLLVLFRPEAQGTIRTLSERLFFLVFYSVFGLTAPPFRIWVFLTQFANIAILIQIARRLTGSAMAGFLAGMIWTANAGLALALGWTSAYNEIASAFCFLLAFRLLLLHIDTGESKYWLWEWIIYLLAFGVLELNVVYPALATGYVIVCSRGHVRKTLYLFLPCIAFAAMHFTIVPGTNDPSYRMYFGRNMLTTLWDYWAFVLGAVRSAPVDWRPLWLGRSFTMAVTLALIIFVVKTLRERQWLALFLVGWFLAVVLIFLPLKSHFTEYYVTVPAIGLAILLAWAIVKAGRIGVATAAVFAGAYFVLAFTDIRTADKYYYERSLEIKHLMTALQNLSVSEKEKTILVSGVDNSMYALGFYGDPFRLIGITRIFLVPGAEATLDLHPEWGPTSRFLISQDDVISLIRQNRLMVLALEGGNIHDATKRYATQAEQDFVIRHPEFVDVGDPFQRSRLGPEWYSIENGFRWMPRRATVKIAGPTGAGQMLAVTGYCPSAAPNGIPARVAFKADGYDIGNRWLTAGTDQHFTFKFSLPSALVGRKTIEIEIDVNRAIPANRDSRLLGLVFGTFAIE